MMRISLFAALLSLSSLVNAAHSGAGSSAPAAALSDEAHLLINTQIRMILLDRNDGSFARCFNDALCQKVTTNERVHAAARNLLATKNGISFRMSLTHPISAYTAEGYVCSYLIDRNLFLPFFTHINEATLTALTAALTDRLSKLATPSTFPAHRGADLAAVAEAATREKSINEYNSSTLKSALTNVPLLLEGAAEVAPLYEAFKAAVAAAL